MNIKPSYQGKVRNLYDINNNLILEATDRISAFDFIFKETLPQKGVLLTQISNHWFSIFKEYPNHLIEVNHEKFPPPFNQLSFKDNSVYISKANRIDYECVVRGYLMGSGYKEYLSQQSVCGISLPQGLKLAQKLEEPIFTPATKVDVGHDENVSFKTMVDDIGLELSEKLKKISLNIYNKAHQYLLQQDILLMDTKFEFGIIDNEIIIIDELLTPDSSRFCDKAEYNEAIKLQKAPPSMDKQILRNYLESTDWNKQPPLPTIPHDIIQQTIEKYREIHTKILNIKQ